MKDRRIAVVTGGTGGIGTAICRRLHADYQVVACYFKNGGHVEPKQWEEEQKAAGFNFDMVFVNVVKYDDCENLVQTVKDRYNRIDVLVNNAGTTADSTFKKMTIQQWQKVIDTNLNSIFNVTRNVLPFMLEREYGRIINISSINGRKGQFGQCNYAATKSALYGFSKSLAQEVASKGITVNTISPGYTHTAMLSHIKEDILNSIIKQIPVGRLGHPDD